jgi:DNA-directed RNA polymerase subunit RPC12/RpoP
MAEKDDGYIRFRCSECGQRLKVRSTREGGDVLPCPKCGAPVNVPLTNLEAIAKGTEMPETGAPGRININPDLLRKRLQGEKPAGTGLTGGPPTLRQGRWSAETAYARIQELDQLAASLSKIDEDVMGQIQRLYRNPDLDESQRAELVKQTAERRAKDIRNLLGNRLVSLRMELRSMEAQRERLMRSDLDRLERLRRACEAMELYARHILGVEV